MLGKDLFQLFGSRILRLSSFVLFPLLEEKFHINHDIERKENNKESKLKI